MARIKGVTGFPGSFEPEAANGLDARGRVETQADLLLEDTWKALDGNLYIYNGMPVVVYDDTLDKIGMYFLIDYLNYDQLASWIRVGVNIVDTSLMHGFSMTFVSTDLSSGYLTVEHNLEAKDTITHVTVNDNSGNKVFIDNIKDVDNNTVLLDLRSINITGTWTVLISALNDDNPPVQVMDNNAFNGFILNGGGFN